MAHIGQQQHPHQTPVHHIRGQHVGIQDQPPHERQRLAARTLSISRDEQPIRPHTNDHLASALITLIPRYNANWLDPACEALDALHLSDTNSRDESYWCDPLGLYYPTSLKIYGRAAQWSVPDGKAKRDTKHLPSWRAT
jgi:hypothetical protein